MLAPLDSVDPDDNAEDRLASPPDTVGSESSLAVFDCTTILSPNPVNRAGLVLYRNIRGRLGPGKGVPLGLSGPLALDANAGS